MSKWLERAYDGVVVATNIGLKVTNLRNPFNPGQQAQKVGNAYNRMNTNLQISNAIEAGNTEMVNAIASAETGIPASNLTVIHADDGAGNNITTSAISIAAAAKLGTTTDIAAGAIAEDSIIGVNIDQIGSGTAGTGLKVAILGYQTV